MSYLDHMTAQMLGCAITQMLLRVAATKLARCNLKVAVVGDCDRLSFMTEILNNDERVELRLTCFAAEKTFSMVNRGISAACRKPLLFRSTQTADRFSPLCYVRFK